MTFVFTQENFMPFLCGVWAVLTVAEMVSCLVIKDMKLFLVMPGIPMVCVLWLLFAWSFGVSA